MIPALAVAVGLVWFFSKEAKKQAPTPDPVPKPDPTPTPEPDPEDDDGIVEFDKLTRWSGEEIVGDSVVWEYTTGVRYEDGTEEFSNPFIVIGDAAHHSFLRQSTSRGAINIPKERTGGSTDQKNVRVFASIADAVAYLNEAEEPRDPNDPVQPQPQPEDEDDGGSTVPTLPTRPDYGGGFGSSLGDMTPSFGAGGV